VIHAVAEPVATAGKSVALRPTSLYEAPPKRMATRILLDLEGQARRRELLDDLEELACGKRDGTPRGHLGRHGDPRSHFQICRGQAKGVSIALEEHVGEDRQRLARFDDVVNHLETLEEGISVHTDFHVNLRWLGRKKKYVVVIVVVAVDAVDDA